jgi:hypothetical protein
VGFVEFLQSRSGDIVTLGLQHLAVVLVAVLLATVIGVSLGIATYRTERPREIVLAVAGAFLTIPSFALLVLFIGPLGLGAKNVVVALTMYGLLPILRNTIIGLRGVDPAIVESAMGMGLDRRQRAAGPRAAQPLEPDPGWAPRTAGPHRAGRCCPTGRRAAHRRTDPTHLRCVRRRPRADRDAGDRTDDGEQPAPLARA